MEMLCKSNRVHKSVFIMMSVVLVAILFAIPATAMFSSSGIEINEEYNEGLKTSALSKDELQTNGGQDQNGESSQGSDGKESNSNGANGGSENGGASASNGQNGKNGENADGENDKNDKNSKNEKESKVAVFGKDGSSSIPYEDEYAYCVVFIDRKTDNERNVRRKILSGELKRTYQLDGEYSKFTGTQFLFFDARETSRRSEFFVYADGKLVYSGDVMTKGTGPEDFSIDVTGVKKLTIQFKGSSSRVYHNYEFAGLSSCYFEK